MVRLVEGRLQSSIRNIFLVGSLLLAACSPTAPPAPGGPTPSTGGQAPGPKKAADQVIRVAQPANPSSLAPVSISVPFNSVQFDSLLIFDKGFVIKPGAAEKWEILPDNSAWRFTLRKDLTFGNGDKVTADDAVHTIQQLLTPGDPANTVGRQLLFASGAKKVDEFTFDVTIRQKDYSLPYVSPNIFIFSKKQFDAAGGAKEFALKPTGGGSGPYELAEYVPNDKIVWKLRSTPHPFRKPTATEIRYLVVPDPSAQNAGMRLGEIDILINVTSPDRAESAKRDGMTVDAQADAYASILFNKAQIAGTPLENIKVRQAMNYAVDKETIAKTLYKGYGQPVGQLGTPGSLNYNENIKPYPYDVATAKRLLAEAGYPNGFKLQGLDYPLGDPIVQQHFQIVQDQHRAIGIEYELNGLEFARYVAVAIGTAPRREMVSAGGSNPNGIFSFAWQFLKCDQPPQVVLYCSQEMDNLLKAAYQESDATKRADLLKQAGKAWADEVPQVFLTSTPTIIFLGPKIKGFDRPVPSYYTWDDVYREE